MNKNPWLSVALLAAVSATSAQAAAPASAPTSAEKLYLQLQSSGLDPSRVYRIREAELDRDAVHISLNDGTIAFTLEAGGHITGALFAGDGEILLQPPNTVERASLALFTRAAILEEHFSIAYLRFNDEVYRELESSLRPADQPGAFVVRWEETALTLSQEDALRLLISFYGGAGGAPNIIAGGDHLLHAYIQGTRLGTFDVRYDSLSPEQISVGQHQTKNGLGYYNVWTSFAVAKARQSDLDADPELSGGSGFEISHFKISADIKLPTEIASEATLTVVPRRRGQRVFLFELSRFLDIKSVTVNGSPVEFIHNQAVEGSALAKRGNDALAVFLLSAPSVGNPIQFKVTYAGSVLSEAANGLLYVGEHGTWYPNVGFAMSSFDLDFRYPEGWTLVATGRLTGASSENGERHSHWVTDRKVPVAGFNLGKYSRTEAKAGRVTVETLATQNVEAGFPSQKPNDLPVPDWLKKPGVFPIPLGPAPPSPSRNLQMVSDTAVQALEFYQQNFGPYPYGDLALTQFPGKISQGWPGLIFLSTYAFLNPAQREELDSDDTSRLALEQIIAHEVAHQWWGDLVTWSGYRNQWIMEALANYSALMLLESKDPASFRQLMQRYRDDLLLKNRDGNVLMDAGPVTLGVRLSSSEFPTGYQAISYGRGTWMFHMLRTMLRDAERNSPGERRQTTDELFVRALRRLRAEYEGRSVTTSQLLTVFESELPRSLWYEGKPSLDWFSESWLNGTAVPRLELHNVKLKPESSGTMVSGTIFQEEAPDTMVTSVPIYAALAGKNVYLGRVFADGPETAFHFRAPARTRKLLLDPEHTILRRDK
jgi:Peptidase family M1 domain